MKRVMEKLEHLLKLGGIRKDIVLLVVSGIAVVCSLLKFQPFPFDTAWIAIVLCGLPIVLEAVIGLVTAFDIKADVLVSLALIASVCIGETFAAGEVAFIMQLGALLEELTVAKARAGIEKLVHLTPQTARVKRNGTEEIIPAEQVRVGDRIRVLPGESVPVDGIILSGQASVNQAVMTGESLPVDKTAGDTVSSGTVNQFGAFEMEATKVGQDSHSANDPPCTVGGRRQSKDRRSCRPLGNMDSGNSALRRGAYMAYHGADHPCRHDSCCILPLRIGAGNSHSHYGRHRQRHKTRLSRSRGRRAGTAVQCQGNCL